MGIDSGAAFPVAARGGDRPALLLLFAAQHTVMARSWFKRRWTRLVPVPPSGRRSCCARACCWRCCSGSGGRSAGRSGTCRVRPPACSRRVRGRWVLAVGSTFIVDHFDLFGLRHGIPACARRRLPPAPFTQRGLYGSIPAPPHGRVRGRLPRRRRRRCGGAPCRSPPPRPARHRRGHRVRGASTSGVILGSPTARTRAACLAPYPPCGPGPGGRTPSQEVTRHERDGSWPRHDGFAGCRAPVLRPAGQRQRRLRQRPHRRLPRWPGRDHAAAATAAGQADGRRARR